MTDIGTGRTLDLRPQRTSESAIPKAPVAHEPDIPETIEPMPEPMPEAAPAEVVTPRPARSAGWRRSFDRFTIMLLGLALLFTAVGVGLLVAAR
jgi:hypothetical protein